MFNNNGKDKIQDSDQQKIIAPIYSKKRIYILIILIGLSIIIFFVKFKNNKEQKKLIDLNVQKENSQQMAETLKDEEEVKNQDKTPKVDINKQMREVFPWTGDENLSMDKDGDHLLGYEEINIYHTDPNNPDTDNDGYSDGEEVKNNYNPNGEGRLEI